jgi:hypothetical protein
MSRWPVFIAVGLGVVVMVNAAFIYVAIATAPDVDPTYTHNQDR